MEREEIVESLNRIFGEFDVILGTKDNKSLKNFTIKDENNSFVVMCEDVMCEKCKVERDCDKIFYDTSQAAEIIDKDFRHFLV